MAAHNYDGDMLTDEIAQVHRSPGFITSNIIGLNDDGSYIKGMVDIKQSFQHYCLLKLLIFHDVMMCLI